MNIFKKILKYWITLSSIAGFLVGWMFVSKTSESEFLTIQPLETNRTETISLPPILSLDSLISGRRQQIGDVQQFTVIQSSPLQPRIGTGGS